MFRPAGTVLVGATLLCIQPHTAPAKGASHSTAPSSEADRLYAAAIPRG